MALHLQPRIFMLLDQLKRASREIQVENKKYFEIWKFNLKMMDTHCVYHVSYLNTQNKQSKWIWCGQLLSKELKEN